MKYLMRSTLLAIVVPALLATSAFAGPLCGYVTGVDDLCPNWVSRYDTGGTSIDMGLANAVGPDGATVYSAGQVWDAEAQALDWITIAHDAETGAEQWATRHDSDDQGWDWPADIEVGPDGSTVYVVGTTGNDIFTDGDYGIAAYDASTGEPRWETAFSDDEGGVEYAYSVAVSPEGNRLYVTGRSGIDPDYLTVAVDAASGEVEWSRRYRGREDGLDFGVSVSVAEAPGDGPAPRHLVYVTGASTAASLDYVTIAYDHEGAERWVTRHDGGTGEDNGFYNALSPDGSMLFVTGNVTVPGNPVIGYDYDWRTQALDTATGEILWSSDHAGGQPGYDRPFAMAATPDGSRLFVAGVVIGELERDPQISIVSYDTGTGELAWANTTGLPHAGNEWGLSLAVSPDGSTLAMAGVRTTGTGYRSDAVAELYDTESGTRTSVSDFFVGPSPAEAAVGRAIAFDPTGTQLFLTGYTERAFDGEMLATDHEMITVAYDVPDQG